MNRLLVDPGDRNRVFELLELPEFDDASLRELWKRTHEDPDVMEHLAVLWSEPGSSRGEYLRALTLLRVLIVTEGGDRDDSGWRWELLRVRALCHYGEDFQDPAAFETVVKLVDGWEALGVRKGSGVADDLEKLRRPAKAHRTDTVPVRPR